MKTVLLLAALLIGVAPLAAQDRFMAKDTPWLILESLKRGNARFIDHKLTHPHTDAQRRKLAAEKSQSLYAFGTVLSCSDSRVPVELIFDVGIMDIFVLRVPGNVCNKNEVGGIEYGVKHANTPLVLVLGHTDCGAVAAAMDEEVAKKLEPNIQELVKPIQGVARRVKTENQHLSDNDLIAVCTKENVFNAIKDLFTYSNDVLEAAKAGKIMVVGAVYDVRTGKVDWLDRRRVDQIMKSIEPPKSEKASPAPAK